MRKIILGLVVAGLVGGSISILPESNEAYAANPAMQGLTIEQGKQHILNTVNAERKKYGQAPVTRSKDLDNIAQDWSSKQAKENKMYHRPNFTSVYPTGWRAAGENVARGYAVKDVMNGWMNSQGHKENILSSAYNSIGIGIAESKTGEIYYTQNFGGYAKVPNPVTTTPPKPATGKPSIASLGDIVAIDKAGNLWNYGNSGTMKNGRKLIGSGWQSFSTIHTSDWNSDGIIDIIAKHSNGSLYVYTGGKNGGFTSAKIGSSGWQNMEIAVGKWKKTDKLPSVIAKDKAGKLWNYPRSGNGIGARKQIGSGWGSLNIVKTDFNHDGGMDIIAKSSNGDLWSYPTNGNGSFGAKKKIGNGWKAYKIYGQPGFKGKSAGLVAVDSAGKLWYYPQNTNGTMDTRSMIGTGGWTPMKIANGG